MKRGPREKNKRRFPEGHPNRGNPTMTTSTVTAMRKRDTKHYAEGKTKGKKYIYNFYVNTTTKFGNVFETNVIVN